MATATKAPSEKKKGPDYGLKKVKPVAEGVELEKILPPEPAVTRSHGFKELKANLLALQDSPNEPFEVAHYSARPGTEENPSGARKIVHRLLLPPTEKERIAAPAVNEEHKEAYYDIEWRSADYDGSDREGSVVIAMYVVPNGTS